ncbi:MAG: D-aminoacylase [Thermoanaerobaculia bacterium]
MKTRGVLLVVLPAVALLLGAAPSLPEADDLVFAGGRVVDGTGAPAFTADVAVRGDRIAAVGLLPEARKARARRVVDARGLVVAPGFIDLLGQSEYNALVDRRAASKISQGITTEVTGEGSSIAPLNARMLADGEDVWRRYGLRPDWTTLSGYFARFAKAPPTINLGTFVGLGGLRDLVLGKTDRRPTEVEMAAMESEVEQAMDEGALGVSASLQYVPDIWFTTDELVALGKVAARKGGVFFLHQRSESDRILESLDEAFRIAREAGIPVDVWHLKTAYARNHGRMREVLARFEAARAQGLDVAASQYPWEAASNGLDACLPPWIREGGREKLLARLADPALRAKAKAEMADPNGAWENQWLGAGAGAGVLVASVLDPKLKKFEGKRVTEIAAAEGKDPRDALMDLVVADRANSSGIHFIMSEDDVRLALAHRLVAFCTDSGAVAADGIYSEERSHPRAWGSATRILGKYVREEKLLPLEEAVRKMTSLPAARARLWDRGILRLGLAADVAVFDPARVRSVSTYDEPLHYSEGVPFVAVNGELVVDGGKITPARPGRILKGPSALASRP